jgi:hypothetical protein
MLHWSRYYCQVTGGSLAWGRGSEGIVMSAVHKRCDEAKGPKLEET